MLRRSRSLPNFPFISSDHQTYSLRTADPPLDNLAFARSSQFPLAQWRREETPPTGGMFFLLLPFLSSEHFSIWHADPNVQSSSAPSNTQTKSGLRISHGCSPCRLPYGAPLLPICVWA